MTDPDAPVDLDFLTQRVIRLERKLKKMRRRCVRCRQELPTIGFRSRLGDGETATQDEDEECRGPEPEIELE